MIYIYIRTHIPFQYLLKTHISIHNLTKSHRILLAPSLRADEELLEKAEAGIDSFLEGLGAPVCMELLGTLGSKPSKASCWLGCCYGIRVKLPEYGYIPNNMVSGIW